ncbi:MAG: hypothetical protein RBS48_08540 [Ignavibacteriaceae bacterium]|jgi:hypothetical protein|nr:hypothetical protein [Ignavibacteriaceae bacterium]
MKITIFYFLLVLIFLNGCKQNDSIVQVNENGLKIPIENNINGKIIENMIGINIENQNNVKSRSISSGELEDQYLIDDFNNDGMADIAVRRGNLIIIDTNRDGISNLAFTFGYGNLERGYYTSNGGIAVVRNSSFIYCRKHTFCTS